MALPNALLRAEERGITRAQATRVLDEGQIIEQRPRAKPFPSVYSWRCRKTINPLHFCGYGQSNDRLYVITVHWLRPSQVGRPVATAEK